MARDTQVGSNFTQTTAAVHFHDVDEHDAEMLATALPAWKRLLEDLDFSQVDLDVRNHGIYENHNLSWNHSPETLRNSKAIAGAILVTNTWGGGRG